jgi:hypothetical protein
LPVRIAIVALPGVVAAAVWVAVFGGRSLDAVRVMLEINHAQGHIGIDVSTIFEGLAALDLRLVMNRGGIALPVTIASWLICLGVSARDLVLRQAEAHPDTLFAGAVSLINIVLVFSATGVANTRLYGLVIVSLVMAGFVVSRFGLRWWVAAAGALATFQAATTVSYVTFGLLHYTERDPARAAAVVEGINPKSRIGAPAGLWFALRSKGIPLQVIEFGFLPSRDHYSQPRALEGFDCVYLPAGHELLGSPELRDWRRTEIVSSWQPYVRLDPPNPVNPCGPQRVSVQRYGS